jgi:putative endonuclease
MNEWHLYIIQCRDGTLYTGITLDVERRFAEHVSQGAKSAKYLKGKGPLTLVFSEVVGEKGLAYQVERKVKRLSKKRKTDLICGKLKVSDLFKSV